MAPLLGDDYSGVVIQWRSQERHSHGSLYSQQRSKWRNIMTTLLNESIEKLKGHMILSDDPK
jgi:hypothetical protein